MIPIHNIILLPSVKQNRSYCWNSAWIKKYESPWSILEKFKYANQATGKDILLVFGTAEVLSRKIITCNKSNGSLTTLGGLDGEALIDILGIDLKEINFEYFNTIFDLLPRGRTAATREKFTYCRTCIESGYHSILHQFCIIQLCPFHQRKLEDRCPNCHRSFDYRLSDELKNPFQCNCGYKFLRDSNNYSKCWISFKANIKIEAVKRWISLSKVKKDTRPSSLIVFNEIKYEQYPNALEQILSIIDPENSSTDDNYVHTVTRASKNMRAYGNCLREYNKITSDRTDYRGYMRFLDKINEEIHRSTSETFTSIAKHIRKTFLQNHKSCMYRAKRGEIKCRYADAYIHWCKFIHNFKNCWNVDNRHRPKTPLKDQISFVSIQDYEELSRLMYAWDGRINRKYESLATTKWVISKFLSVFLLNHFYNWASVAAKRKSTGEIMYLPFQYQNLPLAVLKVPVNKSDELEFHVWMKKQQIIPISEIKLDCPYNSVKKRRNHYLDDEEESEIRAAAIVERLYRYINVL